VPVRAVFLDVGETLVDETRDWEAWADVLGVPRFTLLGVLGGVAARGDHHTDVFARLAPGVDLAAADAERRRRGLFDGFGPEDLYPDALPCLRALKAAGLRVGIAGNQPAEMEAFLHELDAPVDVVASSASWGVSKPAPEFFLRVAMAARVTPAEIAYVGDRVDNDVVPAARAGMVAVHLRRGPWGHLQADWPEASLAAVQIRSLGDLPAALLARA
jgi:HAD superfamily hydrolase (TIGR01662 family)